MAPRRKRKLALVGTDSLRGQEIKTVLDAKPFPPFEIEFYDPGVVEEFSKLTQFRKEPMLIRGLEPDSLDGKDLVFLATDEKTAKAVGLRAAEGRFRAIDLSEAFNEREDVPLIVAGVNDFVLDGARPPLIANPHPVTIILSRCLHQVLSRFGLAKAVVFVLQPVSAFGDPGIQELASQSVGLLNASTPKPKVFGAQIAFNILPSAEPPAEDGSCPAEGRVAAEIRRVLGRPSLPLVLSIIQAPVFHSYSLMAYVELEREAGPEDLAAAFAEEPDFKVTPAAESCAVSAIAISGKDEIFVGRIRREADAPRAFWLWLVADNLTRGSALNAAAIARRLLEAKPR